MNITGNPGRTRPYYWFIPVSVRINQELPGLDHKFFVSQNPLAMNLAVAKYQGNIFSDLVNYIHTKSFKHITIDSLVEVQFFQQDLLRT